MIQLFSSQVSLIHLTFYLDWDGGLINYWSGSVSQAETIICCQLYIRRYIAVSAMKSIHAEADDGSVLSEPSIALIVQILFLC
jgi:hypothetical protein